MDVVLRRVGKISPRPAPSGYERPLPAQPSTRCTKYSVLHPRKHRHPVVQQIDSRTPRTPPAGAIPRLLTPPPYQPHPWEIRCLPAARERETPQQQIVRQTSQQECELWCGPRRATLPRTPLRPMGTRRPTWQPCQGLGPGLETGWDGAGRRLFSGRHCWCWRYLIFSFPPPSQPCRA